MYANPLAGPRKCRAGAHLSAAVLMILAAPAAAGPAAPAHAERVLVLYDAATGEVARRLVRVVDPRPELGLEFSWEPARGNSPGVDPEGNATGRGTLVWRIPGTAAYDPRAVEARYVGDLRRGSYHGTGRLALRDGSWRDGEWRDGKQEGAGRWMQADGTLYEGTFRDGLPEGQGILRTAAGWSYTGGFHRGERNGAGHVRLPGGQEYDVVTEAGVEISSTRPAVISDSTLSGLLPAQGGGGEAARVEISVVPNARVSLEQSIQYTMYNDGTAIQLYPQDSYLGPDELLAVWSGNGKMSLPGVFFEMVDADWRATRAFLDITLATSDGSRVRLSSLDLVDDQSAPHLRPMLTTESPFGCVGHRPWFDFVNYGWGPVDSPSLRVSFARPDSHDIDTDTYTAGTGWYEVPVSGFDEGLTVDLRETLRGAGVDMHTLSSNRFSCPSHDMEAECLANLKASVDLGDLAGVMGNGPALDTIVMGELTYDWTDAWGQVQTVTESFDVPITLAEIEMPAMMAEMGAGGAFATPAPDFMEIELPLEGRDLSINLPLRGNPDVAKAEAHVQLFAERSSIHTLHVEATFGDGSVRSSQPIHLFYLSPRLGGFESTIRPGACYLSRGY